MEFDIKIEGFRALKNPRFQGLKFGEINIKKQDSAGALLHKTFVFVLLHYITIEENSCQSNY